jgi:hypothetical protein
MTGAYLMAERDGERQPVEVEHLTDEERKKKLGDRDTEELLRWLNMVCWTLAEVENKYFVKDELPS